MVMMSLAGASGRFAMHPRADDRAVYAAAGFGAGREGHV
jgi:hypothetical protein